MKYVLVLLLLIGTFYFYKYLNEKKSEEITHKRAKEIKSFEPLEFNRSLYKVQAARYRIKEQLKDKGTASDLKFTIPVRPEIIKKKEEIKELKKDEPSIPMPTEDQEAYIDGDSNIQDTNLENEDDNQ